MRGGGGGDAKVRHGGIRQGWKGKSKQREKTWGNTKENLLTPPPKSHHSRFIRSEERRVGKECRN